MYKIVYINQFSNIGGGETALFYLISKLDRNLFQPIVILPRKGQLSKVLKKMHVQVYYLTLNPYLIQMFFIPGISPKGIYKLLKLIQHINPHLIHLNSLNLAVYAGLGGKVFRKPVIATAHGLWDSFYFFQDLVNHFFVDRIFSNTSYLKKKLLSRRILKSNKVVYIPFGIDTNLFKPGNKKYAREKLGLPKNGLIITNAGRLDPMKDHITFLKSALIIQKGVSEVKFLIVGSKLGDFSGTNSYYKTLKGFIKNHPLLAQNVLFTGFKDNMQSIYQATDILVSSSLSESFGLTLLEASSCGLPIVSTNQGGQSLIVKNNKSGFLVSPKNPDLLAKKVIQLIDNPKLCQQFGNYGRVHVMKSFSLDRYIHSVENYYLNLINRRELTAVKINLSSSLNSSSIRENIKQR